MLKKDYRINLYKRWDCSSKYCVQQVSSNWSTRNLCSRIWFLGADEILLVDISASLEKKLISLEVVAKVANECNVPLTVGGGVKSVEQVGLLLDSGADKVLLNTANLDANGCLEKARKIYGRQCMVVGIDYVKHNNDFYVYDHRSSKITNTVLTEAVSEYVGRGAGELFVNDVSRDGTEIGYDLDAIKLVTSGSKVPVIWCGGAGKPEDFLIAFQKEMLAHCLLEIFSILVNTA